MCWKFPSSLELTRCGANVQWLLLDFVDSRFKSEEADWSLGYNSPRTRGSMVWTRRRIRKGPHGTRKGETSWIRPPGLGGSRT